MRTDSFVFKGMTLAYMAFERLRGYVAWIFGSLDGSTWARSGEEKLRVYTTIAHGSPLFEHLIVLPTPCKRRVRILTRGMRAVAPASRLMDPTHRILLGSLVCNGTVATGADAARPQQVMLTDVLDEYAPTFFPCDLTDLHVPRHGDGAGGVRVWELLVVLNERGLMSRALLNRALRIPEDYRLVVVAADLSENSFAMSDVIKFGPDCALPLPSS